MKGPGCRRRALETKSIDVETFLEHKSAFCGAMPAQSPSQYATLVSPWRPSYQGPLVAGHSKTRLRATPCAKALHVDGKWRPAWTTMRRLVRIVVYESSAAISTWT